MKPSDQLDKNRPAVKTMPQNAFGALGGRAARYFTTPCTPAHGIESWRCSRFWLVLLLYTASSLCIAYDPSFQSQCHFQVKSLFPLLMACLLTASLNWEMLFTGNPQGANLLLQVYMLLPNSLLFARILLVQPPVPDDGSFWNATWKALLTPLAELGKVIAEKLPVWLQDAFAHPWLALTLMALLLVLSFRNPLLKVSAISSMLAVWLGGMVVAGGTKTYLFGALAFLTAGLALQWNPYRKIAFFKNVVARLERGGKADGQLFQALLDIMARLFENGAMDSRQLSRIVAAAYAPNGEYGESDLKLISGEITRRMVEDFELVTVAMTGSSVILKPVSKLFQASALLSALTIVPRLAAVVIVALLWTIMPFDAIPDYTPFIGMFDDLAVNAMAVVIGKNCLDVLAQCRSADF